MTVAHSRPAWATVDLEAVRANVRALADLVAPAAMCAVVKADAYGHGAVPVAQAAVEAGAQWLAVAVVDEGAELRAAGVEVPVLVLAEPPPTGFAEAVRQRLTPMVYTAAGIEAAEAAAAMEGREHLPVHLKVDTGMRRVGVAPGEASTLAERIVRSPRLRLEGLATHFPVADDPDRNADTKAHIDRFEEVRDALAAQGIVPDVLHAANSAAAIRHEAARYDMVRCGIAVYGYAPGMRPAMSLTAEVSFVKEVDAGEALSYGLRYVCRERTTVATVPLGYADGVTRRLSFVGGEVLVGGRRRPMAGTITMDQLLVDSGPDGDVRVGDEVVLLGRQGDEVITAQEWADRLDTITYEVVSGVGPRVPRRYVG